MSTLNAGPELLSRTLERDLFNRKPHPVQDVFNVETDSSEVKPDSSEPKLDPSKVYVFLGQRTDQSVQYRTGSSRFPGNQKGEEMTGPQRGGIDGAERLAHPSHKIPQFRIFFL